MRFADAVRAAFCVCFGLRGMGFARGLLLINGRRRVPGTAGLGNRSDGIGDVIDHGLCSLVERERDRGVERVPPSYAIQDRYARASPSNNSFSSGRAATMTRAAPASRSTSATVGDMQPCGFVCAV